MTDLIRISKAGQPTLEIVAAALNQHLKLGWKEDPDAPLPALKAADTKAAKLAKAAAAKAEAEAAEAAAQEAEAKAKADEEAAAAAAAEAAATE